MMINATNGLPEAILEDNDYFTDVKTATAGAVAAKLLVNEHIKTVGVIEAGAQTG